MIGLLARFRRKSSPMRPRRSHLLLEALESRYAPAAGPVLMLNAQALVGHLVQLSGTLIDPLLPGGATVTFSGAASGTTVTDSTGNFSYLTSNASLGQVTAVGVDLLGQFSNTATASIPISAPTITLNYTYGTGGKITLFGTVTDIDAGGRTVTFSGVVNTTVTTRADGSFSLTTATTGAGTIQATTMDLWGLTSAAAQVTINPSPPVITDFNGVHGTNDWWTFSGKVTAQEPAGMTVALDGLPDLHTVAQVKCDGTWSAVVELAMGEKGTATANTTDWWGQQANEAMFFIG
jgi:hypothetical protein